MKKNYLHIISNFIISLIVGYIGITFIFNIYKISKWVHMTFVIGLIIMFVVFLMKIFEKESNKIQIFIRIIGLLILTVLCLYNETLFLSLLPYLAGIWALLHVVVKFIMLYIKVKDKLPGKLFTSINLIYNIILSLVLLIHFDEYQDIVYFALGLFLCIHAFAFFINALQDLFYQEKTFTQVLELSLPPSIVALIPVSILNFIKKYEKDIREIKEYNDHKKDIETDLSVLLHVAPNGPAMLGHVDMIYNGVAISYGCYDPHNRGLLGTFGDGVVLKVDANDYLYNILKNENKVLVLFGIKLNDESKELLEEKLNSLMDTYVLFKSDYQLKQENNSYESECDDYISRISKFSHSAKFYKIKEGKYKTFFVLSSNCVSYAANILKIIGLNLIDFSGIISPGAYYSFLESNFKSGKSIIVSKKLLTKSDASKYITVVNK